LINAVYFTSIPTKAAKSPSPKRPATCLQWRSSPGTTDNLNFGNPHNLGTFWQLRESVRGLAEACRAFNAPITGGNVSLYNQSPGGPIDPTRRSQWSA
jgi:phosphoribosylformylglycinamidine synthase